jgi:hypothetical protein
VSDLKRLIAREIRGRRERIRGRVLAEPFQVPSDSGGALQWVTHVDVGGRRVLERVPIKIGSARARDYARIGSPVWLDRDAQGRYQITAPADRGVVQAPVSVFDEDAAGFTPGGMQGFTAEVVDFEWYAENGTWGDGVSDFPKVIVRDGTGAEVAL